MSRGKAEMKATMTRQSARIAEKVIAEKRGIFLQKVR
jgi:hypothetical protein